MARGYRVKLHRQVYTARRMTDNWGEPERAPHLWVKQKIVYLYRYIYYVYIFIYIWYVRIPYMHSALFVCDAIFPHVIHVERYS